MSYDETGTNQRIVRRAKVPVYSDEIEPDYNDAVHKTGHVKMRSRNTSRTCYCVACGREKYMGAECVCGYPSDPKWQDIRTGLRWGLEISFFSPLLGIFLIWLEYRGDTWKYCPYCGACIGKWDLICAGCRSGQPKQSNVRVITAVVTSTVLNIIANYVLIQSGILTDMLATLGF